MVSYMALRGQLNAPMMTVVEEVRARGRTLFTEYMHSSATGSCVHGCTSDFHIRIRCYTLIYTVTSTHYLLKVKQAGRKDSVREYIVLRGDPKCKEMGFRSYALRSSTYRGRTQRVLKHRHATYSS